MIYLKLKQKPQSFLEILNILYDELQSPYTLVYTYLDEDCNYIECGLKTRRSFQALFEIARTYFPEITMKEFINTLMKKKFCYYFCSDINKIVFHFVSSSNLFKEDFLEEIRSLYKDYSQILKHLDDLEQFINENS